MSTEQEKLAALSAALDAAPSADRSDSRKRFLLMWEALVPFLPQPPQPAAVPPQAALVLSFAPATDDHAQRLAKIEADTKALFLEVAKESSG